VEGLLPMEKLPPTQLGAGLKPMIWMEVGSAVL